MSIAEDPLDVRPLDEATRGEAMKAVDDAKARGWSQEDLRAWFEARDVKLSDYLKAKVGGDVGPEVRNVLAMISITGLPERPERPWQDPFPDIPAQMKAAARWLLWKAEPNADATKKPRKVPYYATGERRQGVLDSEEDRQRLVPYEDACQRLEVGGYTGLGFALGPDGSGECWQGIDLDNLAQHPGLVFVAEDLPGYTERSPSGDGVHAIGYGRPFDSLGSNTTGIEAYARGRYFTVTGESVGRGDVGCLADFIERRLAPLHNPAPQDTSVTTPATGGSLAGAMAVHDLRSALASMRADDREVWIRMGHALKELGDQGRGLWLEWSQTSPKYDPADASRVWDSFRPEHTGFQAVFAEAQRRGWVNPASRPSPPAVAPVTREVIDPETGEITEHEVDGDLFEVLTISDLRALPDTEWVVDKAVPRQALGFIYGAPGSYKSFLCADLGLSLAYGCTDWVGRALKHPGSVLYIANEGAAGLKNRITAWQQKNGIAEDTERFRLIRKSMSFMAPEDVDRLERTVAAEVALRGPVDTIFVDTVSRVLPGADENLQKDMTVFVGACDRLRERFGATVIGVHHTNKNGEMRGSTVFLGQGDFVFRVEKDEGRRSGVLTCEKQKEAEDGWKVAFTAEEQAWTPQGRIEPVSSLTLVFGGEPADATELGEWPPKSTCTAILKEIEAAWNKGKPWSPHARSQTEGRYAVRNISAAFSVPAKVAQEMIETWQRTETIGMDTLDQHTKQRGLRVLQWLE